MKEKEQSALTSEDKERLAKLGAERLKKGDFYGARVIFREAGLSEEQIRPLVELDKFLEEKSSEKEKIELSSKEKKSRQESLKKMYKEMLKKAENENDEDKIRSYKNALEKIEAPNKEG